jgi:hypothetical protein
MKESKVRADGEDSRSRPSKQHSASTRQTASAHRAANPAEVNATPRLRYVIAFPLGQHSGAFDPATAILPCFISELIELAEERICVTSFKKDTQELLLLVRLDAQTAFEASRLGYLRDEVEDDYTLV